MGQSIEVRPSSTAKLISFPVRSLKLITQRDLAEERLAAKEMREAAREWRSHRARIRAALESGARVEPGIRTVELLSRRPRSPNGSPFRFMHIT